MSQIPDRLAVNFEIRLTPFWKDACEHELEAYQFSFKRQLTNTEEDYRRVDKCDVYLHKHCGNYPQNTAAICIRYGEQGSYFSTHESSFLFTSQQHTPLSFQGFVHNMLWLMKVQDYSMKQAFVLLDTTRWSVHKSDLGFF